MGRVKEETLAEKLLYEYRILLWRKKLTKEGLPPDLEDLMVFAEGLVELLKGSGRNGARMYEVIRLTYLTETEATIEDILKDLSTADGKPMHIGSYYRIKSQALSALNKALETQQSLAAKTKHISSYIG